MATVLNFQMTGCISQTIREYDFTVYKPDVTNVNLRDDIKYIKSGSLSNLYVNGEKADRISVTVMTVGQDGTISQEAVKTTGSFTYSETRLQYMTEMLCHS